MKTTIPKKQEESWLKKPGPGLITGVVDDDPTGIATYSQAGAQFDFNMLATPKRFRTKLTAASTWRITYSVVAKGRLVFASCDISGGRGGWPYSYRKSANGRLAKKLDGPYPLRLAHL